MISNKRAYEIAHSLYTKAEYMTKRDMCIAYELTLEDRKALASKYGCTVSNVSPQVYMMTTIEYGTIYPNQNLKNKVRIRDNNTCQYCGVNTGKLIIEHVIPTCLGGVAKSYNLVVACQSCNMKKKNTAAIPLNYEVLKKENPKWARLIKKYGSRTKAILTTIKNK